MAVDFSRRWRGECSLMFAVAMGLQNRSAGDVKEHRDAGT